MFSVIHSTYPRKIIWEDRTENNYEQPIHFDIYIFVNKNNAQDLFFFQGAQTL